MHPGVIPCKPRQTYKTGPGRPFNVCQSAGTTPNFSPNDRGRGLGRAQLTIGVVCDRQSDYEPVMRTYVALAHTFARMGLKAVVRWIRTDQLQQTCDGHLADADGILIAPGAPYVSTLGALNAIRYARLNNTPALGTCSGFQHMVIEFARNAAGMPDAESEEHIPMAGNAVLTRLKCNVASRFSTIRIDTETHVHNIYKCASATEYFYCHYGVNPSVVEPLQKAGLRFSALGVGGEPRALELADHPFFIGTLYLPQMSESAKGSHPVVDAFVLAAERKRREGGHSR